MAGFNSNSCTYPNCGRKYSNLPDLIYHIEDEHVDFSPETLSAVENSQPTYVPMSYILKFSTLHPKEKHSEPIASLRQENQLLMVESETSSTDSSESNLNYPKDPNDISNQFREDPSSIKRLICLIPNCNKRYKTINGIKYHIKNCHEKKLEPKKIHKCHCGKSYKTQHSLRAHKTNHYEVPRSLSRKMSQCEIAGSNGYFHEAPKLPSFKGCFTKNALTFNQTDKKISDPFIFQHPREPTFEAGSSKMDQYTNDPYLG
nr:juxtaposed with another zinc finger protein 1-like [Onthophagus taurus]